MADQHATIQLLKQRYKQQVQYAHTLQERVRACAGVWLFANWVWDLGLCLGLRFCTRFRGAVVKYALFTRLEIFNLLFLQKLFAMGVMRFSHRCASIRGTFRLTCTTLCSDPFARCGRSRGMCRR